MIHTLPPDAPRWELPLRLPAATNLERYLEAPGDVTVVIPVKDDRAGVAETLAALHILTPATWPRRIIVVDDGSTDGGWGTQEAVRDAADDGLPVEAFILTPNGGPAAARNAGAEQARTPWLWFLDAGVRPSEDYLTTAVAHGRGSAAVAWTGPIRSDATGPFADYYAAQRTLSPPAAADGRLDAFVTASVLVCQDAFRAIGGFDPLFRKAACEDLDIGLRLRPHGLIAWRHDLEVRHRFAEDEGDFRRRFARYGYGFHQFGAKWACDMTPWPVIAQINHPFHRRLARLQFEELQSGWRQAARDALMRA